MGDRKLIETLEEITKEGAPENCGHQHTSYTDHESFGAIQYCDECPQIYIEALGMWSIKRYRVMEELK